MADVKQDYDIETGTVMFQKGQHFDVLAVGKAQSPWWNRTLCEVNNAWVRLGVMEGDFHWHKHDDTDEFFLVKEGHLDIELVGETISLKPGEAFTVPRGVMHCPHARGRSVVLMMENAGVVPTGS
jgi:mannose-6-phosphate isomerase-like protein (cupin superfamily)